MGIPAKLKNLDPNLKMTKNPYDMDTSQPSHWTKSLPTQTSMSLCALFSTQGTLERTITTYQHIYFTDLLSTVYSICSMFGYKSYKTKEGGDDIITARKINAQYM